MIDRVVGKNNESYVSTEEKIRKLEEILLQSEKGHNQPLKNMIAGRAGALSRVLPGSDSLKLLEVATKIPAELHLHGESLEE